MTYITNTNQIKSNEIKCDYVSQIQIKSNQMKLDSNGIIYHKYKSEQLNKNQNQN